MEVDLSKFDAGKNLDRGKSKYVEGFWYVIKILFFLSAFPWPNILKRRILIFFGAKIGKQVIIKPRVNIHFPWKLEIGNNSWIGEEVFILNFELIRIGDNCCISQRSFLCGGNHDYRDPTFKYKNEPINIKKGVWVGAQSFVGPGVVINDNAVITAGSIVLKNQPAQKICSGNPCKPIKDRWNNL